MNCNFRSYYFKSEKLNKIFFKEHKKIKSEQTITRFCEQFGLFSQRMRISYKIKQGTIALLFILFALLLFLSIWYRAEWPAGGQDSWNHYLYARFALQHPENLLDQWAKTCYTLPAIPFAQFGIQGMYVMNLLCIMGGAWLCYASARKLGFKFPWLAAVLFLFQPTILANTISSLTEPFNAFLVAWIVYAIVSRKFAIAAIVTSFLPFVRTEGYLFIPIVFAFLLIKKQYKLLPLLFVGILIFLIIGKLYFNNFLQLFSDNPYLQQEIKGEYKPHGDFFHYVKNQRTIWGPVVTVFTILGIVMNSSYLINWVRKKTINEKALFNFWISTAIVLGFLFVHSFIWYKGMFGSHGLTRVFLVIAPAFSLLCMYALNVFFSFEIKWLSLSLPPLISIVMIYTGLKGSDTGNPIKLKKVSIAGFPGEVNLKKAIQFLKQNKLEDRILVHQLPFLNAKLNKDQFETNADKMKVSQIWNLPKKWESDPDYFKKGTIVLWDNFHARIDGQRDKNYMMKNSNYKLLETFTLQNVKDSIYDVLLFEKIK